jgi:predicted component of type VI protein secretion system
VEFAARTNRMKVGISGPEPVAHVVSASEVLARIIVAHGGEHVEERPLRIGRVQIGRTVDNDVQIDSKYVSRHHCQITTTLEGSILEDLNSTNGVYVKSKRVRRHYLNDGDVVVLGKHEIMYLDERSARARGAANERTGDHPAIGEASPGGEDEPDAHDDADESMPAPGAA